MRVNDDVGRSFVAVVVRNDVDEAVMILADLRAAVLASKLNIIIIILYDLFVVICCCYFDDDSCGELSFE